MNTRSNDEDSVEQPGQLGKLLKHNDVRGRLQDRVEQSRRDRGLVRPARVAGRTRIFQGLLAAAIVFALGFASGRVSLDDGSAASGDPRYAFLLYAGNAAVDDVQE